MADSPMLLLISGPPGTGKSTLAEGASQRLTAPVLAWDWAMGALTGFDEVQRALRSIDPESYRRVGWSILWNLSIAQLRAGRSVILDGVASAVEIEATRRLARDLGVRFAVVVTRCTDAKIRRDLRSPRRAPKVLYVADLSVHRSRVEGRQRDIPGWHELQWDPVAEFVHRWEEPDDADLYIDAVTAPERNLEEVMSLIGPTKTE